MEFQVTKATKAAVLDDLDETALQDGLCEDKIRHRR